MALDLVWGLLCSNQVLSDLYCENIFEIHVKFVFDMTCLICQNQNPVLLSSNQVEFVGHWLIQSVCSLYLFQLYIPAS